MLKETLKRLLYIVIFFILIALLIDHLYYNIKTERLSAYTTENFESTYSVVKLLSEVDQNNFVILYYQLMKDDVMTLKVLTYQKSMISEAYHLLDDIIISPYNGNTLSKSYIVKQMGSKMMVLFGYNSDYNIQVIRNRKVAEFFETSSEPYYLIILDDIEQLYFYYQPN